MQFPKLTLPSKITTLPYGLLKDRLRPQMVDVPEANPTVIYDTQTYAQAGQVQLNYFTGTNSDDTLSNMELSGQLPEGTFFDVWRIFVSPLRELTSTATEAGVMDDIQTILNTARGVLIFTINNKPWRPIPLRFFGDAGQAAGFFQAAPTNPGSIQVGGFPSNGGYPVNGAIKIGPAQKFGVTIRFTAATAVAVATPLQVALFGIEYRRVG